MRVVFDASNSPAGMVAEEVFQEMENVTAFFINREIDGNFPAHGPNPLDKEATKGLREKVLAEKADFGVVFDGDGDRSIFVDEKGDPFPPYATATLLFREEKSPYVASEILYNDLINTGLFNKEELKPARIGHLFMKEEMRGLDAGAGGEHSGHFYFKDFFGMDSGVLASVKLLNAFSKTEKTASEFKNSLPKIFSEVKNLKISLPPEEEIEKKIIAEFGDMAKIEKRDGITLNVGEARLLSPLPARQCQSTASAGGRSNGGQAWINIRHSRTEELVRIEGSGKTQNSINELIGKIEKIILGY